MTDSLPLRTKKPSVGSMLWFCLLLLTSPLLLPSVCSLHRRGWSGDPPASCTLHAPLARQCTGLAGRVHTVLPHIAARTDKCVPQPRSSVREALLHQSGNGTAPSTSHQCHYRRHELVRMRR